MSAMLEYQDLKSPIHKLTGATKLIALIFWALASMITYRSEEHTSELQSQR